MMKKPELKPGTPLDIVFENEINRPSAHYMKAVVYDSDKHFLITSQTSPALGARFLNRRILTTYLVATENRVLRFGFPGVLALIRNDYAIASGSIVEALLIKPLAEPEPTDFRMYFRVRPPSSTDLSLFLEEQKVNLLDISIGGAKFTFPRRYIFHAAETIKLKLIISGAIFHVDASVRSVRDSFAGAAARNLQHVSVEFLPADKKMEATLGKAIMEIERNLLSRGAM